MRAQTVRDRVDSSAHSDCPMRMICVSAEKAEKKSTPWRRRLQRGAERSKFADAMTNSSAPPSASAIREATLAWHRDVRRALARGLRAVAAARTKAPAAEEELAASAEAIAIVVRAQIVAESDHLTPVLAQLDAWGAQRLQRMAELHAREEAAASHLSASNLETSIREILRTLRLEEKELLDADLLDDSVVVRQFGG